MRIGTLIEGLPVRLSAGQAEAEVGSVADDSRQVEPGGLFIARAGTTTDGERFITDAVARGATAVLTKHPVQVPAHVALLLTDSPQALTPLLAERFYGNPAGKLKLIGVTGTNGKTTTTFMIRHVLNAAGRRCGLIGTIEIDDGKARRPADLTTPGAIEMSRTLHRMVENGCDACVMEVSSHALHQQRVAHLRFDAAVFTNLTGDHLDYHQTEENYAAAKAMLFEGLGEQAAAVVNGEDEWSGRIVRGCRAPVVRFNVRDEGPAADDPRDKSAIRVTVRRAAPDGTECDFIGPWGEIKATLPLIGRFNAANMAGALGVAHALGVAKRILAKAIASCPAVPGRLERVTLPDAALPFTVLVDYAHTDDALANVLSALKPITPGRLRVMFGCGGDRDPSKRPRMANVACRLADHVVITSDNPRTEDPAAIIDQILKGVPKAAKRFVTVEPDRAAAIRRIIRDAADDGEGDVIVLAGKGHEDYQIIGTEKRSFDDRAHARAVLAELADKVNVE